MISFQTKTELNQQRDQALKRAAEDRKEKQEVWRQSVQVSLPLQPEDPPSPKMEEKTVVSEEPAVPEQEKEGPAESSEPQPEYPVLCKAKAEYDYEAREDNELTFVEGDIINVIAKDPSGWWTGELKGVFGLFPDNFVIEIQDPAKSDNPTNDKYSSVEEENNVLEYTGDEETICRVKVIFDYPAQEENELTLKEDDIIEVIAQDEGWWTGRLNGQIGVFPDNFVEVIPNSAGPQKENNEEGPPAQKAPSPPHSPRKEDPELPELPQQQPPEEEEEEDFIARFSNPICFAKAEYDYEAQEDNELTFVEGDRIAVLEKDPSGWWTGELNGTVGLFPDNFVVEIDE